MTEMEDIGSEVSIQESGDSSQLSWGTNHRPFSTTETTEIHRKNSLRQAPPWRPSRAWRENGCLFVQFALFVVEKGCSAFRLPPLAYLRALCGKKSSHPSPAPNPAKSCKSCPRRLFCGLYSLAPKSIPGLYPTAAFVTHTPFDTNPAPLNK